LLTLGEKALVVAGMKPAVDQQLLVSQVWQTAVEVVEVDPT
jgi:hypothetical protein